MSSNIRHGRKVLFRSPATPGGSLTAIPGSTGLGVYQVGGFSRFVGIFPSVGSMMLQYRMGCHSRDYQVTSAVLISSGNSLVDVLNFGIYTEWTIAAANSQTPDYLILAEPTR